MICTDGISKNITSNCTTSGSGGNEVRAWIGNRREIEPTFDVTNPSKITGLSVITGKKLFTIAGVKKLLNSGHDVVTADDRPDKFKHIFEFQGFEFKAADVENLDGLKDLVVIVESKDKTDTGDGVFRAYGVKKGLYKESDTHRANDVNGARPITLSSLAGQEEDYSNYTVLVTDYATTLSTLIGLEVVQN